MRPWKVQLDGSVQGGSHLPCLRALQCLFLCERRLRAAAKRIGRQPHGARHDRTNPTMNWAKHPTRPPRRASSLQSMAVFQPSRRVRGKLNGLNLIMIMTSNSALHVVAVVFVAWWQLHAPTTHARYCHASAPTHGQCVQIYGCAHGDPALHGPATDVL